MNSFYLFLMKPTFTQAALWFDISPESAIFLPGFFFVVVFFSLSISHLGIVMGNGITSPSASI